VVCAALESDAASTNANGVGSPYAGNLTIRPLYRTSAMTAVRGSCPHMLAAKQLSGLTLTKTGIFYKLTAGKFVSISLFDLQGRLIRRLCSGNQNAGAHLIPFSSENLTSMHYLLECRIGNEKAVKEL